MIQEKGVDISSTPISCLLDKKVKIRPVPIRKTPFIVGGDRERIKSEQIFLTGTSRSVICPLDINTGRLINPLTELERKYLENAVGVNLDVNRIENNYLKELRIVVSKITDDLEQTFTELDLSNPYDYLKYKICLLSPMVANTKKEHYTAEEWFYIDDNIEEVKVEHDENKLEDTCLKYLYSIEASKTKMYNLLRTYNFLFKTRKIIPKGVSVEWLYNELKDLIKYKDSRHRVYHIVKNIKDDEASYETGIIIQDALEIGELKYNSRDNEFTLPTGELIGKSYDEVEKFLRNPKNQSQREFIKNQIKNTLK